MSNAVAPLRMVATLEQLQREFPVHDWRIAGIAIWPLARIRWIVGVWTAAFASGDDAAPPPSARRIGALLKGFKTCAHARRDDANGDDRIEGPRDLVFLSDGVSFATLEGRRFERFCDPLIEHAHRQGLTTQMWTPLHLYLRPRASPSRFIQPAVDRANVAALIEARLRGVAAHLPGWEEMKHWLAQRDLDTSALDSVRLARDAVRIARLTRLYARWLEVTRPRAAFVVCYYSLEAMAFVRACRRRGIPVTDLQHGVQGEGHGAYAGWGRIPAQADELLPNYFWVWSAWESEAIAAGLETTRVCTPVVGGNPWMSFWTGKSRPETQHAQAAARSLLASAGRRPVVLVTLQFGLADELQLQPLRELIDISAGRCSWWVRLHPAMSERREEVREKIGGARHGIWVDEPSDLPLPALLRFVDAHLTHSSSTVIEAASFGVPSIVTSESGRDLFGQHIAQGIARVELGSADAVLSALDACFASRASPSEVLSTGSGDDMLSRAFARVSRPRGSSGPAAAASAQLA